MHATNDQFSDKLNNGRKTFKMADLLRFFTSITDIAGVIT